MLRGFAAVILAKAESIIIWLLAVCAVVKGFEYIEDAMPVLMRVLVD